MPNPIPVVVLARLAVDRNGQGRGMGRALFRDAALRVAIGISRHCRSRHFGGGEEFYLALGFDSSPREPMMLMLTLSDVRAALSATARR